MNPDELDCLEGWTDYPEMILKAPPKTVLTWVLGKKGKRVKALHMPLKGHLKKTHETATKATSLSEHPPSEQESCTALGNPNHSAELLLFLSSQTSYGSSIVFLRESSMKVLSHERCEWSQFSQGHAHFSNLRCCVMCSYGTGTPLKSRYFPCPSPGGAYTV